MKNIILIICVFLFVGSKCKTKKNCHRTVKVQNNSGQSIIYAIPFVSTTNKNKCSLYCQKIEANDFIEERRGQDCIENYYSNSTWEFYLIDPSQYVDEKYKEYACDSIPIKNKVLKHLVLTLEDIKNNNFIITYP